MVFKISAIIEVAGFPEKHVNEVMLKIIENMKKEPKIKITKEEIAEAKPAKDIFAGFMEFELEIETFDRLLFFCYNYLPSSIELLETRDMKLSTEEFRSGINDLLAYLHRINFVVSNMQTENDFLKKNLNQEEN
jgi:hypothetical protein